MKDLVTKQTTNFNLYIVLTICSLLIGIPTKVLGDTLDSHHEFSPTSSSQPKLSDFNSTLLSQNRHQRAELDAFFSSKYNYCDSELLSSYWGQSRLETKARIGRKVLWGDGGIPYLEQYLVDARIEAIQQENTQCRFSDTDYTYEDAVALAEFWGDSSPWEAKQRIERNLMLGNQQKIDSALKKANRR